jgi:hypothetical protein
MTTGFGELSETITIIHPLQRDEWGDPVPGTGTEQVVEDCLFAPGATREIEVNQNTVQADGTVFAPPDVVVSAHDRVLIRGEEYQVAGKPRVWRNTLTEIPVRLVSG